MALLIAFRSLDPAPFLREFARLAPDMDVRVWPDAGEPGDIRYVLAWRPEPGLLKTLPNLEAVFSVGAGVDHLACGPDLPDVPVVRFVDPNLTMRMTEYVCLNVLLHQRRMLDYRDLQKERAWKELQPAPGADEVRVGVMGLGVLGRDAAAKLASLGFQVAGWSRSAKDIAGIDCYAGKNGLGPFLDRTDILVCLLPLTAETKGILNARLFAGLAKDGLLPGPVLINAGRGGLQVEADILAALDRGDLWAASLDVFQTEPLPKESRLWNHPRVVVTPHNASISDDRAVCRYVVGQIARAGRRKPFVNVVDPNRGY